MAVPWQSIQLAFRGGIDQKTVAEYVDPEARLIDVVNGVFAHDGAVEKRPGMQALTTACVAQGPTIGPALACFTHLGALLGTDGESLYAYSPASTAWTSVAGAAENGSTGGPAQLNALLPGCQATRAPLAPTIAGLPFFMNGCSSVAEGSGYRLITNTQGAVLQDIATGAPVELGGILGGGAGTYNTTGFIINGVAYIFFSDTGHIYVQQVTLSTGAITQTTLANDAANQYFDITSYSGGTGFLLVYNQTGVPGRMLVRRYESLPTWAIAGGFYTPYRSGGGSGDGAAFSPACRVDVNLGIAFIAYEFQVAGANSLLVVAYNVPAWTQFNLGGTAIPFQPTIPGYTQGGSAVAGMISVEPINSTQFWIQCFFGTSGGPYPAQAVYTNATGVQQSQMTYPDCFTVGRPFRATQGGTTRLYLPMCTFEQITSITPPSPPTQFCSVLLFDTRAYETPGTQNATWPRVVATLAARQASYPYYSTTGNSNGGINWRPALGTGQGNPAAGTYRYPLAVNATEEFTGGIVPYLATYTFPASYSYAEGGAETYIAAGVPMVYDGSTVREIGFHMWPSRGSGAQSGTAGSMTSSSTYGYALMFAEVDANGLIHRSAPYFLNVSLDNTHTSVSLALQGIAYTQRLAVTAMLEIYRTAANGTIYYFLSKQTAYAAGGISGAINLTDMAADSSITSNALLPTTGGVLQSVTPPSFRQVIRHVERIWGIDDTGLVVWYSTPFSPSDAPWFNEALTLQFTDETLVALGELDDKLIIWSAQHIWYVEGIGPNNLGQGSDLTVAVLLPADVGCLTPASIVQFPGGLFFQAPSGGIYVLDRGLSVSFIGKEVQDLTAGTTVLAAELVPQSNHIRFVLSSGTTLAFDYVLGRWSRFNYSFSIGNPIGGAMAGNTWSVPTTQGLVAQEKSVTGLPAHCYQDSSAAGVHSFVPTIITLAHLKPGGLDGWVQLDDIQGRADWLDPADVQMSLIYDYGAGVQAPVTWTYANLHGAQPTQARWSLGPQAANLMASAVQVILSDQPPTGGTIVTGQGMRWLGVTIPFLPLGDRNLNLGAAQKQ